MASGGRQIGLQNPGIWNRVIFIVSVSSASIRYHPTDGIDFIINHAAGKITFPDRKVGLGGPGI